MENDKPLSEQDSLRLITEMIQKVKKSNFHDSGTSAILWGSVIGFAGIMSFLERSELFKTGFDWWFLALFAIVPQVFIAIREGRKKLVRTHEEVAIDTVWMIYGISIFAVIAYMNIVPGVTTNFLKSEGVEVLRKNMVTGEITSFQLFVPSTISILMILYAFPTLVTGIVKSFKPMIFGGILCYIFFIISLFTNTTWDSLLSGLAAIFNWLIPGFILRKKYFEGRVNV